MNRIFTLLSGHIMFNIWPSVGQIHLPMKSYDSFPHIKLFGDAPTSGFLNVANHQYVAGMRERLRFE